MNEQLSLSTMEIQGFALRIALSGIGVCAVVLLAARLLRKRSEPLRYGILLAGVIGLLAIPVLVGVGQQLPVAVFGSNVQQEDEILRIPAEMLPGLVDGPSMEAPAEAEANLFANGWIGGALVFLWTLGTGIGLSRLLWGLSKQDRALIGKPWHAEFWTEELKERLADKLGLRKFPEVRLSPAAPMPLVIGIWRPTIVLPERSPATWGPEQWQAVLLHEAAHIARRDPWAMLAQRVAVLLFWWCPLVYLLSRRLNDLRESICDDFALEGPCDAIRYAELLVESAERFLEFKTVPVPLALLDSARGGLEARVSRLLEKERQPMTKLSMPGKLLGAGFLVAACLLTTAATAFSQAQPQPAKRVQIKVIIDGKEIDLADGDLWKHIQMAQKKADTAANAIPHVAQILELANGYVHLGGQKQKADPRIEELVKQAEAIKPGSGEEIRKALQGAAKPADATKLAGSRDYYGLLERAKAGSPQFRLWDTKDGKKIIVLSIEDGKVVQLNEQDLKKLIDGGKIRIEIEANAQNKAFERKLELKPRPISPPATVQKPVPAPPAAEMDALRRQLERLTADLQDLRKRLDEQKK